MRRCYHARIRQQIGVGRPDDHRRKGLDDRDLCRRTIELGKDHVGHREIAVNRVVSRDVEGRCAKIALAVYPNHAIAAPELAQLHRRQHLTRYQQWRRRQAEQRRGQAPHMQPRRQMRVAHAVDRLGGQCPGRCHYPGHSPSCATLIGRSVIGAMPEVPAAPFSFSCTARS